MKNIDLQVSDVDTTSGLTTSRVFTVLVYFLHPFWWLLGMQ